MAQGFLSEIRMMSFGFAPRGWALCNGAFLPINQNTALFSLLGTMYGGNGQTTFALPNLSGRVPINAAGNQPGPGLTSRYVGEEDGEDVHALQASEIPAHTHTV